MSKSPSKIDSASPEESSPKKRAKGTIGIIGDKFKVAQMNERLVEQANAMNLEKDQDIPDIIAIAFDIKEVSDLKDAAAICYDYGCDTIVIMGSTKLSETNISPAFDESIEIFTDFRETTSQKQSLDELDRLDNDLAKSIIKYTLSLQDSSSKTARRPNLVYDEVLDEEVEKNLTQDLRERKAHIGKRMTGGGYPILAANDKNYIYILGGAGPKASAAQLTHLVKQGLNCIHSSVNCAPGKHHFEMKGERPYITHYKNDLVFLENLGHRIEKRGTKGRVGAIVIPCNTAHRSIAKFCPEKLQSKIVDIRQFLETEKAKCSQFILLGTNTTIGADIGDRKGTYQIFCDEHKLDLEEFITPKGEDQKVIMEAIFEIKAGKLSEAHEKILSIVEKLQDGKKVPVILGCTELALAFTSAELIQSNFIDPAVHLAFNAKEFISESKKKDAITKASRKELGHQSSEEYPSSSSSESSEELKSPKTFATKSLVTRTADKPKTTAVGSPLAGRLTNNTHTKQTTL